MTRKALIEKSKREPKFKVRKHNRCALCGRPRGYMRKFNTCRVCFRREASFGNIPGVRKASF